MNRLSRWLALPPLVYLGLLFALPALLMVVASFQWPGEFGGLEPLLEETATGYSLNLTLENYQRLGEGSLYLELLLKSFGYAALTTAICLALGYPLAVLIARSPASWRAGLLLLVVLPFWSNFLIRIYAWMILLSPEGLLLGGLNALLALVGLGPVQLMYTPAAVILCMVYVHLPFMVLPLFVNLERQDPALIEAARDLGAGRWQCFWRVTWPLSLSGVYAGAALVFIPAFGMFAIPDLVGGTEGIMIGNVIRTQFLEARDWPFGSALAIALTLVILVLAWLATWLARGRAAHG